MDLEEKNHASEVGVDCRQYVSRIVNSGDKVIKELFISMMIGVDSGG